MPNTDRIIFSRTAGPVSIKAGETILATSNNAVVLTENGYTPRLYFPATDVNMDTLTASETSTHCPYKGEATYFSAITPSGEMKDIAWVYNDPIADAVEIKGLIAFYEEKLTVVRG